MSGSTGGPSAGGAYAGVGVYPGYGYPAQPAARAPGVGRSRAAFRALILLVFVALVGAGAFLYLRSEASQGLGSGTHTLTTPATIGGYAQNTNPQLQAISQLLEVAIQSEPGRIPGAQQAAAAYYGSTDGTGSGADPEYDLVAVAYDRALTSADLTTMADAMSGFDYATSTVQTSDGVSFHCGPETGSHMASVCMWVDGNVLGQVESASGVSQSSTLAAAEQARDSAES
jgi:hypothetical protein